MSARAILFDLDNTLYPERRFALSGFAAVARAIEDEDHVPACEAFRALVGFMKQGHRATAFQRLCDARGLAPARVERWIAVVREHEPRLRLARRTRRMLADLRGRWRLGLVTNGTPDVQKHKVESLGLEPFFDSVTFAGLPGQGGKPAAEPFLRTCESLGVAPRRAVFVGDDLLFDVLGARGAGLRTIHLSPRPSPRTAWGPDATVRRVIEVPSVAEALIQDA